MLKNYCRSFVCLLCITFSTAASLPSWAAEESSIEIKTSVERKRIHGSVEVPDAPALENGGAGNAVAPTSAPLGVTIMLKSADGIGQKYDFLLTYDPARGVTQETYNRLKDSPLVQARADEWKSWAAQIYDAVRPNKDRKLPADLRAKLNITISKSGKVTVLKEWMDATTNEETTHFVDAVLANIRGLQANVVQFPPKSYQELVKFDLFLNGRQNEVEMTSANNFSLDYDHE